MLKRVPERYFDLVLADKPDLQDSVLSIGVEVTECAYGVSEQASKRFFSMLGCAEHGVHVDKNVDALRNLIQDQGFLSEDYSRHMFGTVVKCCDLTLDQIRKVAYRFDLFGSCNCISNAIDAKVGKLGNYKSFEHYDLFLFCDSVRMLCIRDLTGLLYEKAHGYFEYVYVLFGSYDLHIFNILSNTLVKRIDLRSGLQIPCC